MERFSPLKGCSWRGRRTGVRPHLSMKSMREMVEDERVVRIAKWATAQLAPGLLQTSSCTALPWLSIQLCSRVVSPDTDPSDPVLVPLSDPVSLSQQTLAIWQSVLWLSYFPSFRRRFGFLDFSVRLWILICCITFRVDVRLLQFAFYLLHFYFSNFIFCHIFIFRSLFRLEIDA